jgi:hypothetical protein
MAQNLKKMNKLGMGYWALGIEKILLSFFLLPSSFFFLLPPDSEAWR